MESWKKMLLGALFAAGIIAEIILLTHLDIGAAPKESDVIIVPSGSLDGDRPHKASQLLTDGYSRSDKVIVSPLNEDNSEFYQDTSIELGQIINDVRATSTYENAKNTVTIMEDKGYDSAIVVSSDYHIRRVRLIYERVNKDYNFELTYVSSYHLDDDELVPWYRASLSVIIAGLVEPPKYIGYLLGLYHYINL